MSSESLPVESQMQPKYLKGAFGPMLKTRCKYAGVQSQKSQFYVTTYNPQSTAHFRLVKTPCYDSPAKRLGQKRV